eukprot:scaffold2179_cov165-Amphora_coffeaeformis.AAC.21
MLDYDIEDDLPWDGLWEYVLGAEDFDDDSVSRHRSSSFRRYQSDELDTEADFMMDLLSAEDPILTKPTDTNRQDSGRSATGRPEMKRRLSFTRSLSFNRQVSGQSTSTTGSNSSFRLKGILNRRRKTEDETELQTTSSVSFLTSLPPVIGNKKEETQSKASPSQDKNFFAAFSPDIEEVGDGSQEVIASPTIKETRKRFWKKKHDKNTSTNSSEFLIAFPPTNEVKEIVVNSSKREKRKPFWKKKEEKEPPPTETTTIFAAITSGLEIGDGGEDRESHVVESPDREQRKSFWTQTSSSRTIDEDRSDLESIEAMLGPWERNDQPDNFGRTRPEQATSNESTKEVPGNRTETTKSSFKSELQQSSNRVDTTVASEVPQQTSEGKPRKSIIKAVTKFSGKPGNKQVMNGVPEGKTESDSRNIIRCGKRATDDIAPFYNNPVFLSSFSEDSSDQSNPSKKPVSILKKTRSEEKKALLNMENQGDEKDAENQDEQSMSFLPQALLSWQKGVGVQKSESTDSSKANEGLTMISPFTTTDSTISATSISVNSSVSGFSETGQSKKGVKWADGFNSSAEYSSRSVDTFAGIRKVLDPSWLYAISSSDSDSSMTSSANRSTQSDDLSSVPTDSDASVGNTSSSDKGDSSGKEDQQEVRLRYSHGNFPDRFNQLPSIDENASFRSSLGDDGKETLDARKSHSVAETSNARNEAPVNTKIRKIGNMTTIEPLVSHSESAEKNIDRSGDIDALILGMNAKKLSDSVEGGKETTRTTSKAQETPTIADAKSMTIESSNVMPGQLVKPDCILALPRRSLNSRFQFCKVFRNLSDAELVRAMESGIPVHELTLEELAEIFPKIRMVADEHSSDQTSLVLGNANSFDDSRPALLQVPSKAIKPALGLQSLYEYDFTSGKHMTVSYDSCGSDPRSSLMVITHGDPPVSKESKFAVIQVEASTISSTDCRTRRDGWFGNKRVELPNIPGVDVVGKIYRIDRDSSKQTGLRKGDRVSSLVSQGGNSRYVTVDPTSLVKVPEKVDPAEAACLVETYLTAFQTLHYQQSFLTRYRKNALQGKTILIIGGMSANMSRAMSQLAQLAGSKSIFATARKKDFKQLSEYGILPLSTDPLAWWEQLAGAIDILISLDEEVVPLHYKLLKIDGTVVVSSSEFHEDLMMHEDTREPLKHQFACSTSRSQIVSKTAHYDLYEEWEKSPSRAKKDLGHLVDLLEQRKIVPAVLDRVPLSEVAKIQETLEKRRAKGHYVCEPWLVSKSRAVRL